MATLNRFGGADRVPYWPLDAAAATLHPVNQPQRGGFLRFFRHVLSRDMVGTPVGTNHLADFYRDLARSAPPAETSRNAILNADELTGGQRGAQQPRSSRANRSRVSRQRAGQ